MFCDSKTDTLVCNGVPCVNCVWQPPNEPMYVAHSERMSSVYTHTITVRHRGRAVTRARATRASIIIVVPHCAATLYKKSASHSLILKARATHDY